MSISAIASASATVTSSPSAATTPASTASTTSAASAASSTSETSSSQSAGGSAGSGGGGSAKTIVSEVSITLDGVTTTTITYSDGTTEVQTSARAQDGQGSQSGQTYNAQGGLQGSGQAASSAGL
ncbi:hypothetical protein [Bradyrhizobium symbiodeficiens]|uniref:hypothetical protein n=1 Tax=Bradyrhizobium symbiodeficiens TaxID=1404367 RepID=UPI00140F661E|nr:hypothetical protein [Bradyrhizobium symbiodeficiens]QIP00446.1 hypothetical protein HAU86_11750 [Bradyrhizobium symbiodeficiens]